jgi:hypothetical protein
MTSMEFTEWQAFYQLEPFGELVADERHGAGMALLANINRNSDTRPQPWHAEDFITWRDAGAKPEPEAMLLDDPVDQSNLIRAAMFGLPPRPTNSASVSET